jgi:shikimate 5-dehydrogenase
MTDTLPKSTTPAELTPAAQPTIYFVGVTTGSSSIQRVFPRWADELGLDGARLQGVDLPLHAPAEEYRRVVDFISADPLSRGALVTTHKLDLFAAAADRFDEIDPFARMMGETSCISKRDGQLRCHAKDPISSGLAIDAFLPSSHWDGGGREALLMGAGGSTIAISWYLSRMGAAHRPERIVVTNRSQPRLDHIREIHAGLDTDVEFEYLLTPTPDENDRVLASLSPGAFVVNATGLGKDAPGSPLTDGAVFPERAVAWDLNYRGDLVFLDQARAQAAERRLQVEDGWVYFLHGWTQVISEVFDVDIPTSGPAFDRLGELATAP